jgi:hypothetical protein
MPLVLCPIYFTCFAGFHIMYDTLVDS